jgi:hypothetical protein
MPAVVAMTLNMLRRVPASVEQPSRSVPVRFFEAYQKCLGRAAPATNRRTRRSLMTLFKGSL